MRYSIGIDVGTDGAVALVSEEGFVGVWDTPTLVVERPRDRKAKTPTMRVYDKAAMWGLIQRLCFETVGGFKGNMVVIVIEKVHAMPDQGATSMFAFGRGSGLWEGIAAASMEPVLMPAPQTWKKVVMRDGAKTKEAAVALAGELYPTCAKYLRGPNGGLKVDRAEAILLARFGLLPQEVLAAKSQKPRQKIDAIPRSPTGYGTAGE